MWCQIMIFREIEAKGITLQMNIWLKFEVKKGSEYNKSLNWMKYALLKFAILSKMPQN